MSIHDPTSLPSDLPVPHDDGAALHLLHAALPSVALMATSGAVVHLARPADLGTRAVLFVYPRTGIPGQPPSLGFGGETWESIPGARGCTPQSCGFRDLYGEFLRLGVRVWGLSTSTQDHQLEFVQREHIPFDMLSDSELALAGAMRLPSFRFPVESGGPPVLLNRMALYVEADPLGALRVRKVWYPVFPPDRCAATVLEWLARRSAITLERTSAANIEFVRTELRRHWHSTTIGSRGVDFQADALDGFVASVNGVPAGHASMAFSTGVSGIAECEVVTLGTVMDDKGVGGRLLEAAEDEARRRGCSRIFLTTTNDNMRALEFYQRRGWRLCALHAGMMDRYRESGKVVPPVSARGIPIRDELELMLPLGQS